MPALKNSNILWVMDLKKLITTSLTKGYCNNLEMI